VQKNVALCNDINSISQGPKAEGIDCPGIDVYNALSNSGKKRRLLVCRLLLVIRHGSEEAMKEKRSSA